MTQNFKKEFNNSRSRKPDVTSLVYGKVPPQAPDLEEAVLGAMMLEREKIDEVLGIIRADECFYVDANQKVFKAIKRCIEKGIQVDLLTVSEELSKSNELDIVGGRYYLTQLTMSVVSAAHVETHSRIIVEKYLQREMIRIAGKLIGEAYEDSTDVFDLLDSVESEMFQLSMQSFSKEPAGLGKVIGEVLENIDEVRASKYELTGVPSGYSNIDQETNGWQPTDLIILAARPSVGKTAFALNLAYNASINILKPTNVALFSLEMGAGQIGKRLLSRDTGVHLQRISRPKQLSTDEINTFNKRHPGLSKVRIFIDDTPAITTMQLRSKLRKLVRKEKIGMAIIDYLQLMSPSNKKSGNREQEISQISRDLKEIAKDLNIPIIALSQLNRDIEKRANKEPGLSDLRESGAIEQDADLIMFIYRPSDDAIEDDFSLKDKLLLSCKKHRNGSTFDCALQFIKETQTFNEPDSFGSNNTGTTATQQYPVHDNPRSGIKPQYPTESNKKSNDEDQPF